MSIERFLAQAPSIRVLVVGDCMLDTYISGNASRISPEAPVPVVNVARRTHVPGGAANVASNVASLSAIAVLAGITGDDANGEVLREQLRSRGVEIQALVSDASRRTTTKTRVTAAGQQIVRFDEEDCAEPDSAASEALRTQCEAALTNAHACILSDYAKGIVTREFCQWLMKQAKQHGVPVIVDPKARDLALYEGAILITPNTKEALEASGASTTSEAAAVLLKAIGPAALLITRGEEGMSLFEPGSPELHLPALVNEVADVTGAGDTVVAALAIALGCGFTLAEAARIANVAAGIAVSHPGTWSVRAQELRPF